jgi:integrase/recombinase XerD
LTELFGEFIGYMLHEKELSPVTANVRISTLRAFIRFCFNEGYISTPIHENFKPVKTPEDTLESFSPTDIKKLSSVINDELYTGFRDKVIISYIKVTPLFLPVYLFDFYHSNYFRSIYRQKALK